MVSKVNDSQKRAIVFLMALSIIIVTDISLRRNNHAVPMKKKYCYICLQELEQTSPHNEAMCPHCGQLNYEKRLQSVDMSGHIAMVTGGRIKIGYEIALKLLRANSKVIVTTRFPNDAGMRYASEPDYHLWRENLHIYSVDFRNLPLVAQMIEWIKSNFPYLSIIVNNAAQTIRRPAAYYTGLIEREAEYAHRLTSCQPKIAGALQPYGSIATNEEKDLFPIGQTDAYGEQLDLRKSNSWVEKIDMVHPIEVLEVQVVNATVPFMLCGGLKLMLEKSPTDNRYIVNVSAMEGCFSKINKNCFHPHTNMAKAALNMITRTIADDYARSRIFVTSVDTGWVTNENPEHIRQEQLRRGIYAPLDCIDGAARVLDPIFCGETNGNPLYGVFLKDFHTINW